MQFGHAGACARGQGETAADKNSALAAAGSVVPASFDEFPAKINEVYKRCVPHAFSFPTAVSIVLSSLLWLIV